MKNTVQVDIAPLRAIFPERSDIAPTVAAITGTAIRQAYNIARGCATSVPVARLLTLFVGMTPRERRKHFPHVFD